MEQQAVETAVGETEAMETSRMALQSGLGFRLGRLARALRRGWAKELAPFRLSPPQAAVLRGVSGDPGCSLRALARTLSADPMSVKHRVDELEVRGLIRSGHHPTDRRRRTLTATEAGQVLPAQVNALADRQQVWLDGSLDPAEQVSLGNALDNLEWLLGVTGENLTPPPSGFGTAGSFGKADSGSFGDGGWTPVGRDPISQLDSSRTR